MDSQLLEAKLNQLFYILLETEGWAAVPVEKFGADKMLVRACQRNLQLLVEYASDINGILILDRGKKAPGSYKESFAGIFDMDFAAAFSESDRTALMASVDWRNELIHEYDPEESDEVFYASLKGFLAAYQNYARIIHEKISLSSH